MGVPVTCGMRPLDMNIEGLRSHSMLVSLFAAEPEISEEARKWRSWLIHCLVKTARHYNEARKLVLSQIEERNRTREEMEGGRLLPILDFPFAMEDCITSLEKLIVCMSTLVDKEKLPAGAISTLKNERKLLNKFRGQQEHMHNQIANGEVGSGPIFLMVSDDGNSIRYRSLSMSFQEIYQLIEAAYRDISALFPNHDSTSAEKEAGSIRIGITMNLGVTSGGTN